MKFPGDNEITLTENAIRELLKAQAPALFGDDDARITKITTKTYPAGLVVTFTTDPEVPPAPPRVREPRPSVEAAPMLPRVDGDDGHPF
jgi:hypothetical protein